MSGSGSNIDQETATAPLFEADINPSPSTESTQEQLNQLVETTVDIARIVRDLSTLVLSSRAEQRDSFSAIQRQAQQAEESNQHHIAGNFERTERRPRELERHVIRLRNFEAHNQNNQSSPEDQGGRRRSRRATTGTAVAVEHFEGRRNHTPVRETVTRERSHQSHRNVIAQPVRQDANPFNDLVPPVQTRIDPQDYTVSQRQAIRGDIVVILNNYQRQRGLIGPVVRVNNSQLYVEIAPGQTVRKQTTSVGVLVPDEVRHLLTGAPVQAEARVIH